MNKPSTTLEILEVLTPHEADTLRKRFGVPEKTTNINNVPTSTPTNGDDSGGSGGTPAPAIPQK